MKDNTGITIEDPAAAVKFLDIWALRTREAEWKKYHMTMEKAQQTLLNIPDNLSVFYVEQNASRHFAEEFIQFHTFDLKHVSDVAFTGIEPAQGPLYEDAHICKARYKGIPMIDSQLEVLNENRDFVNEKLMSHIF